MGFSRLSLTNIRNLQAADLRGLRGVNVLFGANGSGKTSVLEGIYLLGMARSFRGSQIRHVIRHGQDQCTVFGEWRAGGADDAVLPVGVTRDRDGSVQIRAGGRNLRSVAELAGLLPMQVINAQGFDLLTGAPAERRQYLDWGVFHVEPGYQESWQRFQRAIKQRNTLLRHDKIPAAELATWDRELALAGEQVDAGRRAYFERLLPEFLALAQRLSAVPAVQPRSSVRTAGSSSPRAVRVAKPAVSPRKAALARRWLPSMASAAPGAVPASSRG